MVIKRLISALVLALILIGNVSTFRVGRNLVSQASVEKDENTNIPDCCRNGMCPHHKHHILSITSPGPAIMPSPIALEITLQAMDGPVYATIQAASLDQIPPTPPPKA